MNDTRNFWDSYKHIYALAPMEDVTDTVFRELVLNEASSNNLNVLFSEFLSTDGFCHPIGKDKVIHRLKINESEIRLVRKRNAKLVAQIWGTDPEKFYKTAQYIQNYTQFDGIDINMGCPQKNIIKKGACSALINNPALAKEIILATIEGTSLPVSVKTRIGFKNINTENWTRHLLNTPIKALTVHGRIQKQMSEDIANWDEIGKVVQLRNEMNLQTKIIGNGDILTTEDCNNKINKYKVDGVMVGRGVFNNFWMFSNRNEITIENKLNAILNHALLFSKTWGTSKPWIILRRFFKIYTYHLPLAAQLRDVVMRTNNLSELKNAIEMYRIKINAIQSSFSEPDSQELKPS